MRIKMIAPGLILAVLLASQTYAYSSVSLLDNYPFSNDNHLLVFQSGTRGAVSFTTPSVSYRIDSVILRLYEYESALDTLTVGFYTDSLNQPGTLVGSFLSNPASASFFTENLTFSPVGVLSLASDTKYWLQLILASGDMYWVGSTTGAPNSRTPSGEASFDSYTFPGFFGTFAINATRVRPLVPEPSEYAMLAGAGLLGFVAWRRARKTLLAAA